MDYAKLIPFLVKHAIDSGQITPEEVAAQLQKQDQPKIEDKDTETVDSEAIEVDDPATQNEQRNEEGEMLENSFKELEVEDAIDKAKEEKQLQDDHQTGISTKNASLWETLRHNYGNHRRPNIT